MSRDNHTFLFTVKGLTPQPPAQVVVTGEVTCVGGIGGITVRSESVASGNITDEGNGVFEFTHQLTLPAGTRHIKVEATDANGLRSEKWLQIKINTAPPYMAIIAPPNNHLVSNEYVHVTVWSESAAATVTVACASVTNAATRAGQFHYSWVNLDYVTNGITTNTITATLVATNYVPWRTNQAQVKVLFNQDMYDPNVDSDGDGVTNHFDYFPYSAAETNDIDKDGIGDQGDYDPTNALISSPFSFSWK